MLARDELSGWLGSFDKYGGGGADRAFAIEMYGGRSYVIDRVKNGEPLKIDHLSVSVLGGIQPDKLSMVTTGPDDGLTSRFLWSWPDQVVDFHLARFASDHGAAKRAFERLLNLRTSVNDAGKPQPMPVKLSPAAENCLEEFAREMNVLARDAHGPFAGAIGKARGHALRLAAVMEYLWWSATPDCPEPAVISEKAVLAAAALIQVYFLRMAEKVFADASIPPVDRKAMAVAKHLRKNGLTHFNARDLRREISGVVREASSMDAACVVLTEAGLIRPVERVGKGRPSKNFEVNPKIFGGGV